MQILDHPNIMKILDSQEDSSYQYLIMDLMIDDLRNVLNNNYGILEEEFVRKIFF